MKVSIIGAGKLGSTLAYTLSLKQTVSEISLIDPINPDMAKGHCLDIKHGLSLSGATKITSGNYETTSDADIIVITSGITRQKEQSRLFLTEKNIKITKEIIKNITNYNHHAIFIIANTPVDINTYTAFKVSGLPKEKIIGTGTLIDSMRFRFLLAELANVDPNSVDAIFLGEHGDSAVPILSTATIKGIPIKEGTNLTDEMINEVVNKTKLLAQKLLSLKNGSNFAPALSIQSIIEAIAFDRHTIMPLSIYIDNKYGIDNICLSLPVMLGSKGIESVIELKMTEEETNKLNISAGIIKAEIMNIQ